MEKLKKQTRREARNARKTKRVKVSNIVWPKKSLKKVKINNIIRTKKKLRMITVSKSMKPKTALKVIKVLRRWMLISTMSGTNPVEVLEVVGGAWSQDLAFRPKNCWR